MLCSRLRQDLGGVTLKRVQIIAAVVVTVLLMACQYAEESVIEPTLGDETTDAKTVDISHTEPQLTPSEPLATVEPSETAKKILKAAEVYKGQPYVFGGRMSRPGCRRNGKRIRCRPGIDCQSLIFFAFEDVLGTRWWDFSVMPTINVERGELGRPVEGLDGVLRSDLKPSLLAPGDVLFFLIDGYNLAVDGPLHEAGDRKYGTWHTGFFHSADDKTYWVLHAAPGEMVRLQPLDDIAFDALFVVRM